MERVCGFEKPISLYTFLGCVLGLDSWKRRIYKRVSFLAIGFLLYQGLWQQHIHNKIIESCTRDELVGSLNCSGPQRKQAPILFLPPVILRTVDAFEAHSDVWITHCYCAFLASTCTTFWRRVFDTLSSSWRRLLLLPQSWSKPHRRREP